MISTSGIELEPVSDSGLLAIDLAGDRRREADHARFSY